MTFSELAEQVNKLIILWAKDSVKLVVAVDGYTGVGKTTLLNNLSSLNSNIIAVNRDDFLFPREVVKEKLSRASDKSRVFELEMCDIEKLKDLVNAFRNNEKYYKVNTYNPISGKVDIEKTFDLSKNIMVVEGVFMFHPELPLDRLWDKRIYLSGDTIKINEQRIKREKKKWGDEYIEETNSDSYFRQVIIALQRYNLLYQPKRSADAVFEIG